MKHLCAGLAVILLSFAALSCTLAETPSWETYDNAELIALLDAVQAEIAARHIEKTAEIVAGTYIGGQDIPVGNYVLTSAGGEDDAGIISLRSVNDPLDDWPSKLYEFTRAEENYRVYVSIEAGDTLIVPYPYTITISGGLQFK